MITGTGRCGTTFLVELLTHLGLETGFSAAELVEKKSETARAGLERDIRQADCPYIVKTPWFCDYAEEILARDDIAVEHILIPIRDLHAAAESRRYVTQSIVSRLPFLRFLKHKLKPRTFAGGLWHTGSHAAGVQEEILLRQVYKLMLAVSNTRLPITFLKFPRIVNDSAYLFDKLRPILGHISYEHFSDVFQHTARPELVHQFNERDC